MREVALSKRPSLGECESRDIIVDDEARTGVKSTEKRFVTRMRVSQADGRCL